MQSKRSTGNEEGEEGKCDRIDVVVVFAAAVAVITVLVVALAIVVEHCCDMRCRVRVNRNKDKPELVRNTTSEHISFGCCSDLCLMFLVHRFEVFFPSIRRSFFPSFVLAFFYFVSFYSLCVVNFHDFLGSFLCSFSVFSSLHVIIM